MPTRVLAFESDTQFARELETEFRTLGCEVTVVDDVNSGLPWVSAQGARGDAVDVHRCDCGIVR